MGASLRRQLGGKRGKQIPFFLSISCAELVHRAFVVLVAAADRKNEDFVRLGRPPVCLYRFYFAFDYDWSLRTRGATTAP